MARSSLLDFITIYTNSFTIIKTPINDLLALCKWNLNISVT